jgi:4-amino-4-deoxy-L-arabinose transferase-like glycosyltransferase
MMRIMLNLNIKKWLIILFVFQLLVWTIGPLLTRNVVIADLAEHIAWGRQWLWGYDKHPPFTAWVLALVTDLLGGIDFPVYLLAQVAILITFFAVWRLALQLLNPVQALVSVLLLQGVVIFTVKSIRITPDNMQLPLWALAIWTFYHALTRGRLWQWLVLAILCAAAFLTKYQALMLFASMLLLLGFTPQGRQQLLTWKPYIALAVFLLCISPHLYWVFQHKLTTLSYLGNSMQQTDYLLFDVPNLLRHFYYPTHAALSFIVIMLGSLIMLLAFYRAPKQVPTSNALQQFNHRFITLMTWGPLTLTLLFSLFTGSIIKKGWLVPYFSTLGIYAMWQLQPVIEHKQWKKFITLVIAIALLMPTARFTYLTLGPHVTGKAKSDAYFPAHAIAHYVTQRWQAYYPERPLKYVGGDHYLSAYVSVYAPAPLVPYMDWSLQQSPWIDEKVLRQQGAMFIWRVDMPSNPSVLPEEIQQRFPQAIALPGVSFSPATSAAVDKLHFGAAILPPLD